MTDMFLKDLADKLGRGVQESSGALVKVLAIIKRGTSNQIKLSIDSGVSVITTSIYISGDTTIGKINQIIRKLSIPTRNKILKELTSIKRGFGHC